MKKARTKESKRPSRKKEIPVHLRNVLYRYLDEPDASEIVRKFRERLVCVCVRDKYPKARSHLLLIPRRTDPICVESVEDLDRGHLKSLRKFHAHAAHVAKDMISGGTVVKCGYHALPSLVPLHMHIISEDFDSTRLKTKKHWNSFTTSFFVSPQDLESALERFGTYTQDNSKMRMLLKTPCGATDADRSR